MALACNVLVAWTTTVPSPTLPGASLSSAQCLSFSLMTIITIYLSHLPIFLSHDNHQSNLVLWFQTNDTNTTLSIVFCSRRKWYFHWKESCDEILRLGQKGRIWFKSPSEAFHSAGRMQKEQSGWWSHHFPVITPSPLTGKWFQQKTWKEYLFHFNLDLVHFKIYNASIWLLKHNCLASEWKYLYKILVCWARTIPNLKRQFEIIEVPRDPHYNNHKNFWD